jgi:hypothetical protein
MRQGGVHPIRDDDEDNRAHDRGLPHINHDIDNQHTINVYYMVYNSTTATITTTTTSWWWSGRTTGAPPP